MKAKQTLLASILVLGLGAIASGEGRPVARVVAVSGGTTAAEGLAKARPVAAKDRLGEGLAIQVADHQTVDLVFYGDGHRESLAGPCVAKLEPSGCRVISGNRKSLARVVNGKRVLLLAQGGNLQSVGGSQAGVGDTASSRPVRPSAPTVPAPASASQPRRDAGGPSGGGGNVPRGGLTEAAGGKAVMAPSQRYRTSAPALVVHGGLRYTQVKGSPSIAIGPDATRRYTLTGRGLSQSVTARGGYLLLPASLKSKVGESFSVAVYRDGKLEQELPFRILSSAEAAEVESLTQEQGARALLAIERLDQLGLPSEAAAKAEELLQRQNDQDVGLLTYTYHLYRTKLVDESRAQALLRRARAQGIKLKG